MTCIIGVVSNGTIHMMGDSAGVSDYRITTRSDEKVFLNGDFIFGFTSSFRMGQVLRYGFTPPLRDPKSDLFGYMVTEFIDAVRKRFRDSGYIETDKSRDSGGIFLAGTAGRLFRIDSDFQVGESVECYESVGCGCEVASGALFAMKASTGLKDVKKSMRTAMEAACHHTNAVRGPFTILSLTKGPSE